MNINQCGQEQLDLQRIQILYQQAGFTFVGVFVSTVVVTYIISPELPWNLTLAWTILTLAVIPIRFILLSGFNSELKKGTLSARRARLWENRWVAAATMSALAFASSIYLPYKSQHLIISLFIGLVLVSMIAGSIVSSITSLKSVMVFMNLSIIPFIARCFMETGQYYWILGCFFIVFYVVFFGLAFRMNQTILKAIKQQIERQDMADKDSLTGRWNRRKLFSVLENMGDRQYSLLLIDVDHFKQFNDEKGHNKGDEMLSEISLSILRCTQEKDLVVRYGGEEFLVLLPGTPLEQAEKTAHDIRERVITDCASTVSIGVADHEMEEDFDALIDLADKAMYQAKRDGRNCVRSATPGNQEL